MRTIVLSAIGLAMLATPLGAQSSPGAQAQYQTHNYVGQWQARPGRSTPPARFMAPDDIDSLARNPWRWPVRPGLDRPYGGHGVPYRTPPQGWPEIER